MQITTTQIQVGSDNSYRIFSLWSDGSIDTTYLDLASPVPFCNGYDFTCTMQVPVDCRADINRDRNVGVGDMLELYERWAVPGVRATSAACGQLSTTTLDVENPRPSFRDELQTRG